MVNIPQWRLAAAASLVVTRRATTVFPPSTQIPRKHVNLDRLSRTAALMPLHGSRGMPEPDDKERNGWSLLLRPTPGMPSLPIGIPVAFVGFATLVPPVQAALTGGLFVALRTAGRSLIVLDEIDTTDPYGLPPESIDIDEVAQAEDAATLSLQIDAATLLLSMVSAALLAPDSNSSSSTESFASPSLAGVALLVLALVFQTVFAGVMQVQEEEQLSKDDKLLNRWDQQFRKKSMRKSEDK